MSTLAEKTFLEEAAIEYERSNLEIPVYYQGELVETLKMDAFLKIDRNAPITNSEGYRQFDFEILEWEVHGYSQALQKDVFFTLSNQAQPRSLCIANQKEADFPALIVYNALYDIYIGQDLVLEAQSGLGVGMNVMQIPPRSHTHFQKSFEFDQFSTIYGGCTNMISMEKDEYEKEVARIKQLRTGK